MTYNKNKSEINNLINIIQTRLVNVPYPVSVGIIFSAVIFEAVNYHHASMNFYRT